MEKIVLATIQYLSYFILMRFSEKLTMPMLATKNV